MTRVSWLLALVMVLALTGVASAQASPPATPGPGFEKFAWYCMNPRGSCADLVTPEEVRPGQSPTGFRAAKAAPVGLLKDYLFVSSALQTLGETVEIVVENELRPKF